MTDTPLEESIPALDEIRKAGKTKYIGLSECSAATLRKANSSKSFINHIVLYMDTFSLTTINSRQGRCRPIRVLGLRDHSRDKRLGSGMQRARRGLCRLQPSRPRLASR